MSVPNYLIIFIVLSQCAVAKEVPSMEKATFAGGCFWCMEPPFEKLNGVTGVVVGYTGGTKENPTYEEVSSGRTGHLEAVQMTYDPSKISYGKLLDAFWKSIDPADRGGQFADRGSQYMTAIFYHSDPQKRLAEESKKELEESKRFSGLIATQILKAGIFYKAEDYHQGYSKKCPIKYAIYKKGSGREAFIKEKWAMFLKSDQKKYRKPAWEELKKILNPTQFNVTQSCSTEPPFKNEYWDNKKEGIYVDVVTGEPLFSSLDKFDSGTGWPSFTKPLESSNIVEKEDSSLGVARIEVKSKHGDSHLGHVFNDGPAPSGFRYCINSASLRFISKDALDKEGYDEYKKLFK